MASKTESSGLRTVGFGVMKSRIDLESSMESAPILEMRSRSVKMPARRPFSITSADPKPEACMACKVSRRLLSTLTDKNGVRFSWRILLDRNTASMPISAPRLHVLLNQSETNIFELKTQCEKDRASESNMRQGARFAGFQPSILDQILWLCPEFTRE